MTTKIMISLVTIPFKLLMFLFSPKYFKNKTNLGKILKTNDNVLDTNRFNKPGRRIVVTKDNGKNIRVNKITSDKDYDKNATNKQKKKQKFFSTKINYKNYPNSLHKESVVDLRQYSINQKTKKPLKYSDKELKDTGDKLTRKDLNKLLNRINK